MATLALALLGAAWGGYLWLRDLSVLRVRHVEITGLARGDDPAIRRSLRERALRMTMLHVRDDDLERAVDSFPVVRSVSTDRDFPSTLHIEVEKQVPVAALVGPSRRVAVAGDGTLLRSLDSKRLPAVRVDQLGSPRVLEKGPAARLVGVLAQAPSALRPLLARAYSTREGVRVAVRDGPLLYFGTARRFAAKWAAATRVLADPGSEGAQFIDVRQPERPVAGDFPGESEPASAEADPASLGPVAGG
jgi:cell division protein FtsQ